MSDLGTAIAIAATAFKDKADKGGSPYILHCLHVMNKMKYYYDEELMIIAVLHDLIEDTEYTIKDLAILGFSERVTSTIDILTHKDGVEYMDYIVSISYCDDAVIVKLQDLRHNSDITRMKGLREKDFKRLEKYHKAWSYLNK